MAPVIFLTAFLTPAFLLVLCTLTWFGTGTPGRGLRPGKLVKICFHHSIIDLTVLIRLAPETSFCILIGGQNIGRPGIQGSKALPQRPVKLRKQLFF